MKDKSKIVYAVLVVAFMVVAYNQFALMDITRNAGNSVQIQEKQPVQSAGDAVALQQAIAAVIPTGVPDYYGEELGVDYDSPVEALNIMAKLDGDLYEDGKIKFSSLSADDQSRYIKMGMSIACEFCCGATTLIQRNGQPACGCAHSAAMRGLMKYLLQNTDLTDDQIMSEVIKVKSISFPQDMVARYMQQSGLGSSAGSLPQQIGGC